MGVHEADIKLMKDSIKEVGKKSVYTLESHKIWLKKMIEYREWQIEALRRGQPVIDGRTLSPFFFRAMGFVDAEHPHMASEQGKDLPGEMSQLAMMEKASNMGLPVDIACDKCCKLISATELGILPVGALVECDQHDCPPKIQQKVFIATKWASPIFHFDIPIFRTEASLQYVVEQLREFIEVAEKTFPGVIKYDEDKLIEYLARHENMLRYYHEIYEMTKHQPSPISGWDMVMRRHWVGSDPEWLQARRDEIAERVAKGIAAVPGEKARVVWVERIDWFDAFGVLAKYKIASLLKYENSTVNQIPWWSRPAYYGGRKLTPLEEVAAYTLERTFGSTADVCVDGLIRVCRDLKIDGIIFIEQMGCAPLLGWKRLIVESAERELGIQTLVLEGSENDSSYVDKETTTAHLEEFAQMLLSQKGQA